MHEITADLGHCPAQFHVWPTWFVFCRSQRPAGFQISIVIIYKRPARIASDRHEVLTAGHCVWQSALRTGLLYMINYWNLKNCRSLWPAEDESCRSHMKLCRTVTDDRRLFHGLSKILGSKWKTYVLESVIGFRDWINNEWPCLISTLHYVKIWYFS